MGFADSFAIPARTLRVGCAGKFLVCFRGPFKGGGELILFDLIVVVDEYPSRVTDSVRVIARWGELMSMPSEIDVEGRDGDMAWI
jgi:hypothetical protein